MIPTRSLLPILLLILFPTLAFAAKSSPLPIQVSGTVMSAETNKPVANALISFYAHSGKEPAGSATAQATSDGSGAFRIRLVPGYYNWHATAEGFGLCERGTSITPGRTEAVSVYLRKAASLSGRIVDGAGKPTAGITIAAGKWLYATSGPDGKFRITGLDARGYEPGLRQPGWVLEKSAYLNLNPGEEKELGDVTVRRAATLLVTVAIKAGDRPKKLGRIMVNLSGSGLYRSATADSQGRVTLADLPPGRFSLALSDERLTGETQEIEIREGEKRELTLKATIRPPSLTIEEYSDVFLPGKPFKVSAHGLWMDKAKAVLSLVSSDALLSGKTDLGKPDNIPVAFLKKVTSFPVSFKPRRDSHTRNARLSIPALAPGPYLLELSGNGASARFGFLVTRLGLVAKTSPNGTLLFTSDLISGKALPGVAIAPIPHGTSVTSGPDGMAHLNKADSDKRLTGRSGTSLAFLEMPSSDEAGKPAGLKGYIYCDRPAYRPGQTAYFKGVLRQRSGEEYRLPSLDKVHVTISDSGEKAICESDCKVTAAGSFQGECPVPAVSALGDYTITATGGGESWQGSFKVLEYRKPEFEVRQQPDRRFLVAGDTAQVRLSARYYFGAPVAGGKVNWRIYIQPNWGLGAEDDDSGYDEGRFSGGYSDFINEGELRLDDNGEALIPITAKSHDMPFTYTLEADVSDAASRQVSSSAALTVVPSLVALQVKSGSYLARPGETVEVTLKAATWEGAPKAIPVKLAFQQQTYDKKSHSYSWKTVETVMASTSSDGTARTRFAFPSSGYWQIKAEAADEAGRKSNATSAVWVWKEGYDWQGSYRELEAEFDRKSYKPGETARLIVRSPATGGSLLLTLEGRDILTSRTVPLNSMVEVIEIPVTKAQAPLIHVSVVTVGSGRFYNRTLPLRVDHQPGKLDLKVTADKPVHAPGDKVRLTIASTVSGKPVPTELSLAVVDEAIFAVAPERSDDIYQFFRGNREHLVTTLHSFSRVYLGGAAKDTKAFQSKDDDLKGLKIRKIFKDTAFWQPIVTVNDDGTATAEFSLPDNLTTWRATAIGHTLSSDFGSGREKFIARLDLMARLSPPRFLTVGDQLKIPGVITSMTDKPLTASGRFEASGLTLMGENSFSGPIAAHGTLRINQPVRADQSGNATLRLLARGTEQAQDKGDAMELTLPVLARGLARTNSAMIALQQQEGTAELNLPEVALPGSARLKLNFAPTITASLNSAINRLVEFPYGCVEQTLSRFIPAVHVRALLEKQAWQPDAAAAEKLPLAIAEGFKKLQEMQHEDGGWGWWKNDATSLTMTAHALYGLGLAKQAGLTVPPDMLKAGLTALDAQLPQAATTDLPRAYRAITINGNRNKGIEERIRAAWKTLPLAEQLAYGEALGFAGQTEELKPLLDELKGNLRSEGSAAYLQDPAAESWWYGWRWGSSTVETSASMLSQLVKQRPSDPLAARLAEFLARRQTGGWWQTTTSSAAAVTALADYVAAVGETHASYSARLTLDGAELATYQVKNGVLAAGPRQLTLPATVLKTGLNRLKLTKQGGGAAYLSATMEYTAPPETATSSSGLKLERTLYRITSVKQGERWLRQFTPLKPGEPITVGDDIEVRLTLENAKPLEYLIIEDRLPAGFESRESDRDPRFMDDSSFFNWYSHSERHDERMAFFITSLPAGRHEFRHVIYPELEGNIIALPAATWPMYQPELRGESTPWQMEVKPGK